MKGEKLKKSMRLLGFLYFALIFVVSAVLVLTISVTESSASEPTSSSESIATFVIGQGEYVLDSVSNSMDAVSYIKNGNPYLVGLLKMVLTARIRYTYLLVSSLRNRS